MAASTIGLLWIESVFATAILLFGLGVGWNVSFVAATAQMADRTSAAERGKLLGFSDLLSGLFGATLALLGGYALDSIGVAALAIGATVIVVGADRVAAALVGAGQAARDDVALNGAQRGRRSCELPLSGQAKRLARTSSRWRVCRSAPLARTVWSGAGVERAGGSGKGAAMCNSIGHCGRSLKRADPRPMVRLPPQSAPR